MSPAKIDGRTKVDMFSPFIFWPWLAGLVFLIAGLLIGRHRIAAASGLEKLVNFGPILFAAPLAVFGAEHLAGPQFLKQLVPQYMPARLFWAYFVGVALVCAAISIILGRYVRLSAGLLGVMFLLFVLLIHLPRVASNPRDRISWAVALRDLVFACAAWALAGSESQEWRLSRGLIAVARICIALVIIFFGGEHFLHPTFAPGVPLGKLTPSWVPLGPFWGYLTGLVLFVTGVALLARKKERMAATWAGLLITLLTLFIYLPLLPLASRPSELNEAINYIADTMLFAGALLVLARALPRQ